MTKVDLVAKIAQVSGATKKATEDFLAALTVVITKALKAGDEVKLTGLGIFRAVKRAARTGVNPQTRQPIKIAATTVPAFRVSSTLKAAVSGK